MVFAPDSRGARAPVSEPWTWEPEAVFTELWFLFAGGFSPDPILEPYRVDFPLDPWGEVRPEVWSRWIEHDPAELARNLTPATAPAIYFDCGMSDELYFYPMNLHLDQLLTSMGIAHEFQSYDGGHFQQLPSRFPISLRFLDNALHKPASAPEPVDPEARAWLRLESGI